MTALAAVLLGLIGLAGGLAGPRLIRRVPEPAPDPEGDAQASPKELYAAIADLPRVALGLAAAGAVMGASTGYTLGWEGALLPWAYLIPVGLVLALIDWRTRLLPTYLIAPSYAALVVLVLVAGALDHDWRRLVGAALGWLAMGGFYFLMWLVYPRGMGYGDVRLSGLLGIALGYLGWVQLVVGAYAGLLLGALLGLLLSRIGVVDRRRVPFGPFLVLGAWVGVLAGPAIARSLGY